MKRPLLFVVFCVLYGFCAAKESLLVVGTVFALGDVCDKVSVTVYEDGEIHTEKKTNSQGGFLVVIPKDKNVILSIEKEGYVGKKVEIDTSAEKFPKYTMTFFCDVDLYEDEVYADFSPSVLEKPLGIVQFNSCRKRFQLDKYLIQMNKKYYKQILRDQRRTERACNSRWRRLFRK